MISPDIEALKDETVIQNAWTAYQAACANVTAMEAGLKTAKADLATAEAAPAALVAKIASGGTVTADDRAAAQAAIATAKAEVDFYTAAVTAANDAQAAADRAIQAAPGIAYAPSMVELVNRRITAAAAVDTARAAIAAAEMAYQDLYNQMQTLRTQGARNPGNVQGDFTWGTVPTEAQERRHWNRPASA